MQNATSKSFIFNESLDRNFLDELFDGDTLYAETVFEDFLRDLPAYWNRVESACKDRNMPALGTCIHTCKTLFGYVGFTDLQEFCQAFENKCANHSMEELMADYSLLVEKKEKAQRVIESEYSRLKSFNESN